MKKIAFFTFILLFVVFVSSSFKTEKKKAYHNFRSGGAAANFDEGYVGAPFAASTCGICHSGGTFAPTINVQLVDALSNPVTSYTPGVSYNLTITITPTSGAPRYSFQTTCVNATTENNINNWGPALPINVSNVAVSSGRNYVEQNARLNTGIITIPWTAPIANSGAVRFYSVGNTVNSNNGTGGDNTTATNILNINEAVVPVKLVSFNAKEMINQVSLFWETAQESNSSYFNVERSSDGSLFTTIGKLQAKGNSNTLSSYSFLDKYFTETTNYYRLAQYDLDGKLEYSKIIKVQTERTKNSLEILPNPIVNLLSVRTSHKIIGLKYSIVNSVGAKVLSGIFFTNEINVKQLPNGNYFLQIEQQNKQNFTIQFLK